MIIKKDTFCLYMINYGNFVSSIGTKAELIEGRERRRERENDSSWCNKISSSDDNCSKAIIQGHRRMRVWFKEHHEWLRKDFFWYSKISTPWAIFFVFHIFSHFLSSIRISHQTKSSTSLMKLDQFHGKLTVWPHPKKAWAHHYTYPRSTISSLFERLSEAI